VSWYVIVSFTIISFSNPETQKAQHLSRQTYHSLSGWGIYNISLQVRTQDWPQKYISIPSDSQAALKALQAARTMPPLVRQYTETGSRIDLGPRSGYGGLTTVL
jgi:hypothetical protein